MEIVVRDRDNVQRAIDAVNRKHGSAVQFRSWEYINATRDSRARMRCTLKVASSRGIFASTGPTGRHSVNLCWHGHTAFMEALFALEPDARIESALARYNGVAEFNAHYDATGSRNIGSQVHPILAFEACDCGKD